jgi:hypothetical protein
MTKEKAMSIAIRVPREPHEQLQWLAAEHRTPIGQVVAAAVHQFEQAAFWDQYEKDIEALRADPAAWEADQAGIREWDATLLDGLE